MKWYDLISLGGLVIAVIGAIVFLSISPAEKNSLGLLILLLGVVVVTYGYALRYFFWVQKRGKYIRP